MDFFRLPSDAKSTAFTKFQGRRPAAGIGTVRKYQSWRRRIQGEFLYSAFFFSKTDTREKFASDPRREKTEKAAAAPDGEK